MKRHCSITLATAQQQGKSAKLAIGANSQQSPNLPTKQICIKRWKNLGVCFQFGTSRNMNQITTTNPKTFQSQVRPLGLVIRFGFFEQTCPVVMFPG